jgi:monovalent cation:H+ antiporter-2, CPA2 family
MVDPTWSALWDILILLTAALLLGTLAEELRQNAILGYLLAGTLVGPNVLSLVRSDQNVEVIAQLGVALLMFTIGLDFSLSRLRKIGRVAIVGGTLQVVITLAAAGIVTLLFGFGTRAAIAVGAMVAMTSTSSVLRVLVDRAEIDSLYGRNALGISLLQDVSLIPLMLLVAWLSAGEDAQPIAGLTFLRNALLALGVIAVIIGVMNVIVPRMLNIRRWTRNRELPILLAIVLAIGSAAAAQQVKLSPSMGAFIAGALLGGSPFAAQIRADIGSLRTLLITLFFASIGMIGEPQWVMANWITVAWVVVAVVVGKAVIVWGILWRMRWPHGLAVATGLCVAPLGEFTFVLADVARGRIIDEDIFRLFISTTIITLFLTPYLVAAAPRLGVWIESKRVGISRRRMLAEWDKQVDFAQTGVGAQGTGGDVPSEAGAAADAAPANWPGDGEAAQADIVVSPVATQDIVVVGYGPAGHSVVDSLLPKYRESILVIDLNPRNAAAAKQNGVAAQIGDAAQREVLEHAGVKRARVVVVTLPDPGTTRDVIHHCKYLAPDAAVIVRARYHIHRWDLQYAGAHRVVDEEEEVGNRLADEVKKCLGTVQTAG